MVPKVRSDVMIRKLKRATPYILSGLSVIGVFATAVFSAKATAKALKSVENVGDDEWEILKSSWKLYIPAALTAIATAACIIGNGVATRKQQASLISAYALLAKNYKQYTEKVKELYGPDAHKKIIESLGVERAKRVDLIHPDLCGYTSLDWGVDENEVEHLFYESFSGRYFTSTISRVYQAEITLNRNIVLGMFVSINDFYTYLGLNVIEGGDEIGWCMCDGYTYLDFDHYKIQVENVPEGLDALVIDYDWVPQTQDELDNL